MGALYAAYSALKRACSSARASAACLRFTITIPTAGRPGAGGDRLPPRRYLALGATASYTRGRTFAPSVTWQKDGRSGDRRLKSPGKDEPAKVGHIAPHGTLVPVPCHDTLVSGILMWQKDGRSRQWERPSGREGNRGQPREGISL